MSEHQEHDEQRWVSLPLGRRTLLRGGLLGGAGLAAAALIGCGDDDDDDTGGDDTGGGGGGSTATATATETATASPEVEVIGELVEDSEAPFPYNYPEPAIAPKPGGTMTVAATWDVSTIDPVVSASGGTVTVPNMVYNRFLGIVRGPRANPFKLELEPELAESWERSEDGLTFTFNVTPGIKWQDIDPLNGRDFVAEDARFALERYASEGSVHTAYYVNVESFEAVDPSTLKVTMKAPTADFLNPIGSEKQTIFPRELVDDDSISTRAIGTGPMILDEMTQGEHVTFTKNPAYWEGDVLLDGFEFRVMPDAAARLAAFRVGQVDYAYSAVSDIRGVNDLQGTNPDVQINVIPLTYMTFTIGLNLDLPKYADERVRRAISMALDRAAQVDIVYDGLGKRLTPIHWPYVFDEQPDPDDASIMGPYMAYNPDEAKKLLMAAGYENLEMNNAYYPYTSAVTAATEATQAQLGEVGISMTGGAVDYTEFNSQWVPRQLADASTSGWITSGFDADNWFYGHVYSESPGNRWRIKDAEIDEWAVQQQLELDPDARREIHRKIWDKDLDMMYRPALAYGYTYEVLQPWDRGLRWGASSPTDNSSYYSWGDQIWYVWLNK